jgi:hypothetical protein
MEGENLPDSCELLLLTCSILRADLRLRFRAEFLRAELRSATACTTEVCGLAYRTSSLGLNSKSLNIGFFRDLAASDYRLVLVKKAFAFNFSALSAFHFSIKLYEGKEQITFPAMM